MSAVVKSVPAVDLGRKYIDMAYQYADDVRDGKIPVCRLTKLAIDRWFRDLETGGERGLYFDENEAARVFRFSGYCRQYEGEFAGLPLELQGWQCFTIANIYGWMRADGTRRFRIAYERVPRKNGKTTKLAYIGNYGLLGDREGGPRVYSAATKRDQAKELYDAALAMLEQSPKLSSLIKSYADRVVALKSRGRLQALSKDSKSMDGLNVHYGLIDELHAHPTSAVWDVIKSARGARKQPLIWTITTAGFIPDGIDADQLAYATKVLEGSIDDDSYFAIIYTVDDPEKWDDEEEWKKANPNLGVSVNPDDMREQCRMAKEIPTERIEFMTKRLNIALRGEAKWMNMERLALCETDYDDQAPWSGCDEFKGKAAWGGLDLSSVEDMTALSFTTVVNGKTRTFVRAYLPQGALDRRLAKGDKSLEKFVVTGHLQVVPGQTVDYEYIKKDMRTACEYFNVQGIAFDRWNSNQLVNDMLGEGVPMIEFGQGFGSMSAPMKELMIRVLNTMFEYSNPVLYWAMGNLVADINPAGDIKPDKSKIKEKIDPAAATIMALGVQILMPEKKRARSIYADGEL
ncbi:MAG: terminase TerL endonuclease subunit [Thalassolituus sp.]